MTVRKSVCNRSDSQEGEAAYIADTIREGVEQGRKWGRDFAVLYRNNVLSDNIAAAFIRAGIPYRVYKGRDFFSRAEVKDMFAYLWVIENPADELRLRRIINTPARKIGDKSVETAMQLAVEYGTTLYDVVCHASSVPCPVPRCRGNGEVRRDDRKSAQAAGICLAFRAVR